MHIWSIRVFEIEKFRIFGGKFKFKMQNEKCKLENAKCKWAQRGKTTKNINNAFLFLLRLTLFTVHTASKISTHCLFNKRGSHPTRKMRLGTKPNCMT